MKFKRRFVKKFKYNYKTRFLLPLLVLVCVSLGLGYAYLQTDLAIVGVTKLKDNEWNVHFDNVQPVPGSVTPVTAPSISDLTTVSFSSQLENPGDKYEFYADVVNAGTIDAMVDSLVLLPELTTEQREFFSYEVTYRNGAPISQHELLVQGTTKTIKVSFKYLENQDETKYPQSDTTFNISATINYVQSTDSAVDYIGAHPCTFDGEMVQGAEYINGQFAYVYKGQGAIDQNYGNLTTENIDIDGWGVVVPPNTYDPITTTLCSSINNKPIVSMSYMFLNNYSPSIDLSSFDTSNVINMRGMFTGSYVTTLDVSGFDTSKVTDMSWMFSATYLTSLNLANFNTSNVTVMSGMFSGYDGALLDLSSFDTSNVTNMSKMFRYIGETTLNLSSFDTSNVTNMSYMFDNAEVTVIDLSSFDTSNVTNMSGMFDGTTTTTGYGRTQADCDRLNASPGKPSGLTFVVKS